MFIDLNKINCLYETEFVFLVVLIKMSTKICVTTSRIYENKSFDSASQNPEKNVKKIIHVCVGKVGPIDVYDS